jgi:hypothetical protein
VISESVKDRLRNWKFLTAAGILDEETGEPGMPVPTDAERETVGALARAFGNCGWFEGTMGDIVRAAVWSLGVVDD